VELGCKAEMLKALDFMIHAYVPDTARCGDRTTFAALRSVYDTLREQLTFGFMSTVDCEH